MTKFGMWEITATATWDSERRFLTTTVLAVDFDDALTKVREELPATHRCPKRATIDIVSAQPVEVSNLAISRALLKELL